jgi:2',3'-cyclic-nucleotide 2'-phosphodiesterase (5'-nucleotidase family)
MPAVSTVVPEVPSGTNSNSSPTPSSSEFDLTAQKSRVHIRLFHTNDVYDIDNWPKVKKLIDSMRLDESVPGNLNIALLAGDFLAPSVLSSVDQGECMIDCMNKVGFDFVTIGNHECDVSLDAFANRVKESKFPWINTNIINFPSVVPEMPKYLIKSVKNGDHSRSLGFIGVLCNQPSMYLPGAFWGAQILPTIDTAMEYYELLKDEVDHVIPITHQYMPPDRTLAQVANGKFPFILGGHDHSPFIEVVADCPIIKTGMDAHNVSIVDMVWENKEDKFPEISYQLAPVKSFEVDADLLEVVKSHSKRLLGKLMAAEILELPENLRPLTSKDIRVAQRTMGTFCASNIRDGFMADCFAFASGSIRRGFEYPESHKVFNFCDLVSEMPFADNCRVVYLPGKVLADMCAYSRAGKKFGTGAFLQFCDAITADENNRITHIAGEPLDENRLYRTVASCAALDGVDDHIYLLEYLQKSVGTPNELTVLPTEGHPDLVLQKTSMLRWSARKRVMEKLGGRTTLSYAEFSEIYAGQPDWFVQSLFKLLDWDNDGQLGVMDMAVVACTYWFALQRQMSAEELKERLTPIIGKESELVIAQIMENTPESTVVSRNQIGEWYLKVHASIIKA